ncbi:universal stress protein [Janthinobacterium fluminis]|uniref:Universal stress protein n=1 Tax=Janthinobacterium fluminis TaxID=2987524 RepID=A0ABT5K521_9BURK|nr:universal stress protein [Janthinobacterium fluminis]MDC8760096.1 universal stress protein [Janthinobacterium fluminis]
MAYKTVLVHIDDSARVGARIDVAAAIAGSEGGHLIGVALTGVSRFLYQNITSSEEDPNLALHLRFLRERAGHALAGFERHMAALGGADFEQRVVDDEAGGGISLLARYADLVVIGQLNPAQPSTAVMNDFPAYVVIHAGRPVLVVPYAGPAVAPPRQVLIAWNASREASRAVSAALPLLRRAAGVHIVVLDAEQNAVAHGPHPGADIALYLRRHGVASNVVLRQSPRHGALRRSGAIGETLLSHAADVAADLLVMGAYGHSRFRETILGGVTRTVLESMPLPVLMAH